jgi:MFS family permease
MHLLPVWGLAVIAFVVSAAGTFVDVSSQSLLPQLVPAGDLRAANQRLQSTQRLASQLVGPVIGGYAAALGAGWGPGVAAIMYLVVVAAFTRLPALIEEATPATSPQPRPQAARARTVGAGLAELREGASYFRHRPDLTRLAATAGLINMAYAMSLTILPIWAVAPGRLHLSQGEYGLLLGSVAVGGIASSVFARPILAWLTDRRVLTWGGPVLGASFFVLAVPNAALVCVSLVLGGALAMLWNLTVVSYRQTTISREVFGRVVAVYRWVTYGVLPLGSLLAGVVASLAGTVWVFVVAGAITVIGALALGLRPLASAPAAPAEQ